MSTDLQSVPAPSAWFTRLAATALALCLVLVVLGAFVRLSHAGLSCPDWPTCYGKATWPVQAQDIAHANAAYPQREVEVHKAWREQVHRHIAAVLGVMVLGLALLANWASQVRRWVICTAVLMVGCAIPLYMHGEILLASVLAASGEMLLLIAAFALGAAGVTRVAILTLAVVIFQALLGKWTVTWNLKPVVVMAHLMGGLTTLGLLGWMVFRPRVSAWAQRLGRRTVLTVLCVLGAQIALGGWVSSNYAALSCPDFPTCQGQWWPATDFGEGFVLWRGIGVNYEGGVLDAPARTAIHLSHRIGAVIASLFVLWLGWRALREPATRAAGLALLVLLPVQVGLGIANVVAGLPLAVATAHNGVAALLVLVLVWLLTRVRGQAARSGSALAH